MSLIRLRIISNTSLDIEVKYVPSALFIPRGKVHLHEQNVKFLQ
jgi:hypothetical protein